VYEKQAEKKNKTSSESHHIPTDQMLLYSDLSSTDEHLIAHKTN